MKLGMFAALLGTVCLTGCASNLSDGYVLGRLNNLERQNASLQYQLSEVRGEVMSTSIMASDTRGREDTLAKQVTNIDNTVKVVGGLAVVDLMVAAQAAQKNGTLPKDLPGLDKAPGLTAHK